ncbi:class I SAM-dependent methyltransferase [bacterium]|nr:class I SAM-dependent methyltransferase [bacterium]
MKMTKLEKRFVNRQKKAEGNIQKIECAFQQIEIKKMKTVLELGCGVGFVSKYLIDTYPFIVYGTDYDTDQIQTARKLHPKTERLHFQVEDATKLSFEDSGIDLVISQNVFHHIPDWEAAIKEISRVLRSGGYLLWLDLTFPKIVKTLFQPFVKNYGLYTSTDIKTTFEANGFEELFHERLMHGPMTQHHFLFQRNELLK